MIDLFSKYAEAYAVRSHTAPVVAKVLMDNLFARFGMPKRILSDQGPEFESEIFREFCKAMEIDKVRTSPYRPTTNGCIERFHRTLNSMLGKVVETNQRNWDECLPSVMAACRAARHDSTGFSPNRLVFNRENRMPIDIVLGDITEEMEHQPTYNDYVTEMQDRWKSTYRIAREHLHTTAQRRKTNYDIKVKSKQFYPGQWVWYYYPRKIQNRSPKWSKVYDGPFLVIKRIPPCDYVIQRTKRSAQLVVHADKLKECHSETPPSWLKPTGELPEDSRQLETGSHDPGYVPATLHNHQKGDRNFQATQCTDRQPHGGGSERPAGRTVSKRPRRNLPRLDEVGNEPQQRELPSRARRQPVYLRDYQVLLQL